MLTWVGKKALRYAIAYPAQLVETFSSQEKAGKPDRWSDWPKGLPQTGLLFHGDNKDVLAYLLANGFRGKVKLIYIDPPFDSGADYVRKVSLRGAAGNPRLESEGYTLGEQIQYTDIWANDSYLQFMFERLLMLRELLTPNGFLALHSDSNRNFQLRFLLDEVFGREAIVNEIVWQSSASGKTTKNKLPDEINTIYLYRMSIESTLNPVYMPLSETTIRMYKYDDGDGRGKYRLYPLQKTEGPTPGTDYIYVDNTSKRWPPPQKGWRMIQPKLKDLENDGRLYIDGETIGEKAYWNERPNEGKAANNLWNDIANLQGTSEEITGFPTQKPEALLGRIVELTSEAGTLVLDCFLGSGSTSAVAQKLGRRWIGADINKGAIQTTIKRLQGVIQAQAEAANSAAQALPGMEAEQVRAPTQLGFAVYRVNDYDLQIQHNEAFNLAVEHLGMTRTKTDAFFDGTLGRRLVKIVPFNHPVTSLDLEEVKRELANRPEEERDIVVVGLGRELAVTDWLEDWNKLRKQGSIPNKIEVIELRSDPKYGGFFTHEPAKAKVAFKRTGGVMEVTIEDFISPTILERLRQQNKDNPLFQPHITDWRSMVDSVMIDPAYDGKVFNIGLADVPEKKDDLVEGKYVLEAVEGATIAVKLTDMLGEEVLVAKTT
jgi:adenine-specific DNA-methyltransferase